MALASPIRDRTTPKPYQPQRPHHLISTPSDVPCQRYQLYQHSILTHSQSYEPYEPSNLIILANLSLANIASVIIVVSLVYPQPYGLPTPNLTRQTDLAITNLSSSTQPYQPLPA